VSSLALLTEGTYPLPSGRRQRVVRPTRSRMAPQSIHDLLDRCGVGLAPTWELLENSTSCTPLIVGRSEIKRFRFFNRLRKTLGHIGDALVEDDVAPGLFAAQRSLRVMTHQHRDVKIFSDGESHSDAHEAFEALAWSMAKLDGGDEFLAGLHRLFDVSRAAPLIDTLRSSESLDVLLAVMRQMQLDDRSAATAPTEVTVADACLALDLIERQLRPLFEPPPIADLCHATSNGLAVLPGLGAYWTYGTPLIISEHESIFASATSPSTPSRTHVRCEASS